MQTILGAGGPIGNELAKALKEYTKEIRLVSRYPNAVNPTDQLFKADLTQESEVDKAVEGSEIAYLTAGLPYKAKVWKKQWPLIMQNVIEACKKHQTKLVFFDNIYMYDRNKLDHMTEETPIRPTSKKGEVRAKIASMITDAVEKGQLTALIARAPDFYGPKNSFLIEMTFNNLAKGKKAMWFGPVNKIHSFIFTPDAAKGTAILGNTRDAFNQVWHLPTYQEKLTIQQWLEIMANSLNVPLKFRIMPFWMINVLGIFIPVLREFKEMTYQFDRDYFFDSSKFNNSFGNLVTNPHEAFKQILQSK